MTLTDTRPLVHVPPAGVDRLLAAGSADLADHRAMYGLVPSTTRDGLIPELERSGLDGRGGAAFPTWRKLAAIDPARGRPVVIGNGAEGEPLSIKDATLLTLAPHLVLDGLLLLADLIGARETYLYTGAAHLAALRAALTKRGEADAVTVRAAPDTFISGEASAVVNAIKTGRAVPTDRVTRLTETGLRGRPTLVYNVETLAQIALIARWGADWFRQLGSADEPGTRLLSITGHGHTRVIEAAGGIRLDHALAAAGFDPASAAAVLVGGYHGAWVPGDALATPLSRRHLNPYGAVPGAAILMLLDHNACPLTAAAQITTYLAGQSARQCGPCLNGLPRLAETLSRLANGTADATTETEVRRLAQLVTGRGSCHHPDGTARFVLSTLTTFASDVAHHLFGHCERTAHV